ncbi:MAG: ATP-binding protein [Thermacetogeniaceae bacterium]
MEIYGEDCGSGLSAFFFAKRQAAGGHTPWLLRESKGDLFGAVFFGNSLMGIALLTRDDVILEANQVWCDFLGYPRDELIGKHLSVFIHPEDTDIDAEQCEALLQGVIKSYVVERRYLRKDGTALWGRLNICGVRDRQGVLLCKLAILEDITPLKDREMEAAVLWQIYSSLLHVLEGAFLSSPAAAVAGSFHPLPLRQKRGEWLEMLAEQVIKAVCRFVPAKGGAYFGYDEPNESLCFVGAAGIAEASRSAFAGRRFRLGEEQGIVGLVAGAKKPLYVPDFAADPRWLAVGEEFRSGYFAPLVYKERLFGVIAFFSDRIDGFTPGERAFIDSLSPHISAVWENVRLFESVYEVCGMDRSGQEQLLHVKKMEAIGRLAGGIAHALNNQLTVIQASVDLQLPHISRCSPLYNSLLRIRKAAWNAANLARQLMLFGQSQPQFKVVLDLNQCLLELREMLQRICGEDVAVRFDLAGDLLPVMGDAANIDQVIINLVLNARDAMPEGGTITIKTENVKITVPSSSGESAFRDFVCLAVSDTGTGIDEELISFIFEPFFTTKRPGEGAGLGLSVAYGIVKAHGGWINVKTKVGSGTTFEVLLPAVGQERR